MITGMMDVETVREQLKSTRLSRADLPADPLAQFERWLAQARQAALPQPLAMGLATAGADGAVSSRMVMLRYFDERGFVFFTGLETEKVRQIGENGQVSLLFPWLLLERQVRVAGTAVPVPTSEALKFFAGRSRESQMSAWLTQSDGVVSSRALLRGKWAELVRKFGEGRVPLPSAWGGYRVAARRIEFWQGHADGLHDRFVYTWVGDGRWRLERLIP
jgi:pyridoxamine 5'-phosphate oxidase